MFKTIQQNIALSLKTNFDFQKALTLSRVASGAREGHGAVRKRHDAALWTTSGAMKSWRGLDASGARPSLGLHGYRQLAKLAYDDGNNNPAAATPPRRINEAV